MESYSFVGLDVHKKSVSYCVKQADGTIVREGKVRSVLRELVSWAQGLPKPWAGGLEATLFSGWIYDALLPHAASLKVGHPYMMKAIAASKRKNDQLDARMLADLLRCDLFPSCYMAPSHLRELRRMMRYRNLMVREATRLKNKTSGLLMEVGAEYDKKRLHGKRYFTRLVEELEDVPESVKQLLTLSRSGLEVFESVQKQLLARLRREPAIVERVERLMAIRGVGPSLALTWVLEVGEPKRFPSINDAVSYCGLVSAEKVSADKARRGPLSKQRNKHLQSTLIEAAKLAPRWNPQLAAVHERELARGSNRNCATLAVARKLVAYLLSVDKSGKPFEIRTAAVEQPKEAAAIV
jgi:transposase